MGFWRGALLVAGGAVAGYLATKAGEQISRQELVVREAGNLETLSGGEAAVAKFFDSPLGRPLQPFAQKTVAFAARVKSGMDEKEAELQKRFEQQKQDLRPGSIDSWDRPYEDSASLTESVALDQEVIEVDSAEEFRQQLNARLARDKELGEDFFA